MLLVLNLKVGTNELGYRHLHFFMYICVVTVLLPSPEISSSKNIAHSFPAQAKVIEICSENIVWVSPD